MKCMTHSALCTKWLNYADDMLQFIGLLGHSGCGHAGPNLEGIKRLFCVCEDEREKYIWKGIRN